MPTEHPADAPIPRGVRRDGPLTHLVLVLLLLLSGWIQWSVVDRTVVEVPLRADAGEYFSYALNLAHSGTYSSNQDWRGGTPAAAPTPDKVRSPGYPYFLRLVGRPAPTPAYLRRVACWQGALGVLSVLLTWCIARRFLTAWPALAATGLVAINPHLATINTYLLSESLFTATLLVSVLATLVAFDRPTARYWLYAGLAWGACSLVRPTVEFLPLLFLAATLVVPALHRFRRGAALATLAFALAVSPWMVRNLHVPDAPGTSLMAKSLVHGSYPGFMYRDLPQSFGFPYRFDPDSARASQDAASALGRIADNFRDHPLRQFAWYALGKPGWFLSWGNVQAFDVLIYPVSRTPYYEDVRFALLRMGSLLSHWPLMLLGLAASLAVAAKPALVGLDARAAPAARVAAWIVLYAIAVHVATAPFPRYSIPFRPLLFALAMLPLASGIRGLRARLFNRPGPSGRVPVQRAGDSGATAPRMTENAGKP